MRRQRSSSIRLAGMLSFAAVLVFSAWSLIPGCKQGRAPYDVIDRNGRPVDFLPPAPGGIVPGTTHQVGLLYRYDPTLYQLFAPYPGTSARYIRRGEVLAPLGTNPIDPLLKVPDQLAPALKPIYDDPRLFGFVSGDATHPPGFIDGDRLPNAAGFMPLQVGNWWQFNHNSREWTRTDSVSSVEKTAPEGTVYLLRVKSQARVDLGQRYYRPAIFGADIEASAGGPGIFFHGWTLVAEREVPVDLRGCVRCPPEVPIVQRNPRFLWLGTATLGTNAFIDQCLDGLPGVLDPLHPVQITGPDVQIGDIYNTWTYLGVPRQVLLERLRTEPIPTAGGRCGWDFVVDRDTLRTFPTKSFNLLCRFEARAERAYDQLEWKQGEATVGRYGAVDGVADVVKLIVTMYVATQRGDIPTQYMEIYYARNIGEVVRQTGLNPDTRSLTRLRTCFVNGRTYLPSDFGYSE